MMKRLSFVILSSVVTLSAASAEDVKPGWLERSTFAVTDTQDNDAEFEFETIQPLMETPGTKAHTIFMQGRLA